MVELRHAALKWIISQLQSWGLMSVVSMGVYEQGIYTHIVLKDTITKVFTLKLSMWMVLLANLDVSGLLSCSFYTGHRMISGNPRFFTLGLVCYVFIKVYISGRFIPMG